ncbi:MAG: TonB-dependent receptor [Bacteroidota bacterium]
MLRIAGVSLLLLIFSVSFSQRIYTGIIVDSVNQKPLQGVVIREHNHTIKTLSDSNGRFSFPLIQKDTAVLSFSMIGYRTKSISFLFIANDSTPAIQVFLQPLVTEIEEVVIQTTRTGRNLSEIPTRIEAITHDELDEKGTMKPGDIRMLLNESTGITTQTTSPVSGLASLRIQGLDGRYTQILKDGMPLYTGFSGGLGILQIAPLDLKQVEYIKGSASTLYGGGAIAGLVNLITKTPTTKPELSVLLNGNSGKGFDANLFYGERWKSVGTTVFASYNHNGAFDPAGIGLTAIPQTSRITINPKLFWYPDTKTMAWMGINTTIENRYGGDISVINGMPDNTHQYFERNQTSRLSSQLSVIRSITDNSKISLKNSIGFLNRQLILPNTLFSGNQWSSFTELSYLHHTNSVDWVMGLNEWTEKFVPLDTTHLRYNQTTIGAFIQNTYKIKGWVSIESGLRIDYNSPATKDHVNKPYLLPRLNGLFTLSTKLSSRIGGGFGYKMPTPFIDEAEKAAFRNMATINYSVLNTEKSYGVNADLDYHYKADEFSIKLNQLFFYSRLDNPLLLQGNALINANGYLDTKGAETNLRIGLDELTLYLGYSYTDVKQHFANTAIQQPLTAKHRLNADLTYEIENSFRFGLEAFYTGAQILNDGSTGKAYTTFGALVQKIWKRISVFVNAENITGVRQSRWGSIYSGSITQPVFKDIYAPLEGAIFNAGTKITIK